MARPLAGGTDSVKRLFPTLTRTDADSLFNRKNKYLAVSKVSRTSCLGDSIDHFIDRLVFQDNSDLNPGQELRSLGVGHGCKLTQRFPDPFGVNDRKARNPQFEKFSPHFFEFLMLNVTLYFFHSIGKKDCTIRLLIVH